MLYIIFRPHARPALSRAVAMTTGGLQGIPARRETLPYAVAFAFGAILVALSESVASAFEDTSVVNIRRTTLLIASILAVGTGWLTLTYLSSLRPPPMGEQRPVLVAAQEITARERITRRDVRQARRGRLRPSSRTRSPTRTRPSARSR